MSIDPERKPVQDKPRQYNQIYSDNGHVPNSLHIPFDELRSQLPKLDQATEVWVYCQVGLRGSAATRILQQKGGCGFHPKRHVVAPWKKQRPNRQPRELGAPNGLSIC